MKTTITMKLFLGSLAVGLAFGALADGPTISQVTARQRWPWSRLVDIDYVLACDGTQRFDVAVQAFTRNTALSLPERSLSGDLNGVSYGEHHIVWDPTVTAYTNSGVLPDFRVTLTTTTPPVYMIVDLTKSAGADGQIEYIYPGDARFETYGRFTNVWFGVTNDSVYATDKLVLRRLHAGTFKMGDSVPPTISTTLTKDFYAGVFEVTQRQWELIMGDKPSNFNNPTCYASRPVEQVSYEDIRGASNSVPSVNWPMTDRSVVSTNSYLGKLRAKTGLSDFDLPTEAQWEYLCRAGTLTYYNDNGATPGNTTSNAQMDVLGRYKCNGGLLADGVTQPLHGCGVTNGTASVGSYQPNGWGVYDTHENVWEWCLDWYTGALAGGSDPSGAVSGTTRARRGGCWANDGSYGRSASRSESITTYRGINVGFRLVRPLP